ncbi:MAG: N-acetylneuraminate synthase family protein [Cohaesibacteraceae bacterium]|nr:N-acetylneuraminate synthase family protein [Cohaesibacteraceae bacterium]
MIEFNIAGRSVGPMHPPLVIAEVGINHEGDLGKALEMVHAAHQAGAEIVKFQCHITDKEMIPTDMKPGDISDESLWDIIKRCELTAIEELEVQALCNKLGIIYLSTPFSREAADRLQEMNVPAFKIGSGECNNLPLIEHICGFGKPMIISTGMNDLKSIRATVEIVRKYQIPYALTHCTSMYPTPYKDVRLGGITDLASNFPDAVVGLSDHSLDIYTCLGAVALGASILEKHFTISRDWPGPDTGISIEPEELANLVKGSEAVWLASGGNKSVLDAEKPVIEFAYASVVAIAPIKKGEILSLANIWVKRPGTGPIHARDFNNCLGKIARLDLNVHAQLSPGDFK